MTCTKLTPSWDQTACVIVCLNKADIIVTRPNAVSASERRNLPKILDALRHAPVLTIADMERFAELGGMINLTTEQSRVRFEMNPAAIQRVGLKAGSQLFRLARIVNDSGVRR